jgi:hypothetical protein
MKTSYLLIAILACSIIGAAVGARGTKTVLLVVIAALSGYALFRLLG